MRSQRGFALAVLLAWSGAGAAQSALGGGNGLLTTPDATVLPEGTAAAHYARHYPDLDVVLESDSYYAAVGFAPGLEIGGRTIAGALRSGRRDLSVDVRYRLPWQPGGVGFAVGGQDLGGTFQLLRRWYAVGTWDWRTVGVNLGVGDGRTVLDGVFGGVEWRPWPLLALAVEHDAEALNGGFKLRSPDWAGWRAGLTAAYRGALDEPEFGVTLTFPLGRRPAVAAPSSEVATVSVPAPPPPAATPDIDAAPPAVVPAPRALRERLVALGFEAVHVGQRAPDTIVVRLENRRYNHSQADALGLALGVIAAHAHPATRIELVLCTYGVPQLALTVQKKGSDQFISENGPDPFLAGEVEARYVDEVDAAGDVAWFDAEPSPRTGAELVIEPVVRTLVATEHGLLDYALAARGRLTAPLGGGFLANVGAQAPLARSSDLRAGGVFESVAPRAGVDLATVQYLHAPAAGWNWLWSAGRTRIFRVDFDVAALEQSWAPGDGRHRLRAKLMTLRGDPGTRNVALAGYTWFDARRDYSVALTGGRFYAGDGGARIDVSRYFGDTIVGVMFKAASRDDQAIGVTLSLPLTPRRDARPGWLQVKGPRRWSHGLSSTINSADGSNPLRPLLLYEPMLDLDLHRDIVDAGRLGGAYLREELPRLREAYETFGG